MDPTRPKSASSDAVPRAVEFLIHLLLRWVSFGVAICFGILLTIALRQGWHWMIDIVLGAFTLLFLAVGFAMRPRGRLRFDRVGPIIVVPAARPNPSQQPTAPQHSDTGETKPPDS